MMCIATTRSERRPSAESRSVRAAPGVVWCVCLVAALCLEQAAYGAPPRGAYQSARHRHSVSRTAAFPAPSPAPGPGDPQDIDAIAETGQPSLPTYEVYPQPAASCPVCGVQCNGRCCPEPGWDVAGPIPWEIYAQGEYVGPHRLPHIPEYRLRTDDQLDFVYRITARRTARPYRLQTGDQIRIRSMSAEEIVEEVLVEPDGMISLPLLGQVPAAGLTLEQLRKTLEEEYQQFVTEPKIAISPISIDNRLQELRAAIDNRAGIVGGQSIRVRVTPEGTVQLPAVGSIAATGLSLTEMKREVDHRYAAIVEGIEITPILSERAPRYVYVLGEVAAPGRYTLEGPTTLMQSIALAGSWNVGAHLREVVVFRRDDNWRLMATKLDIRGALYGHRPCPADEIWLRDSDIVVVPKHPVLVGDDWISLLFTRGLYAAIPFVTTLDWTDI